MIKENKIPFEFLTPYSNRHQRSEKADAPNWFLPISIWRPFHELVFLRASPFLDFLMNLLQSLSSCGETSPLSHQLAHSLRLKWDKPLEGSNSVLASTAVTIA